MSDRTFPFNIPVTEVLPNNTLTKTYVLMNSLVQNL